MFSGRALARVRLGLIGSLWTLILLEPASAYGYKQTFQGVRQRVRSTPRSGRSRANVRFRAEYVRFTPRSGHFRDRY